MLRRLVSVLPAGTVPAGAGVAILAVASYVHLAFAGHALSDAEMANLSVLWAVVFTVGLGIFFPVEQEVTRVAAARRTSSRSTNAVWRRGNAISLALLTAITVVTLSVAAPLAHRLFVGDLSLVLVMLGGLLGLAAAAPLRGTAAGTARFDIYGRHLAIDGVARMVIAAALTVAGLHTAAAFGTVLAIAPLLATLALILPVRDATTTPRHGAALDRVSGPPATPVRADTAKPAPASALPGSAVAGAEVPWRELGRGVAPLVVSALVGQFVLNSPIVAVRLLDPGDAALVAGLLAALILVRVPVFVFAALQASLLSGLATTGTDTDLRRFGHLLRHASAVVTALAVVAAIPSIAAGPVLTRILLGAPDALDRTDFAILAVGTWAYLLALVFGQAVMALHRHRVQMIAWIAGALVLVLATTVSGDLLTRVEVAYALGSWIVAGGLVAYLAFAHPGALSGRRQGESERRAPLWRAPLCRVKR